MNQKLFAPHTDFPIHFVAFVLLFDLIFFCFISYFASCSSLLSSLYWAAAKHLQMLGVTLFISSCSSRSLFSEQLIYEWIDQPE